MYYSASFVTHPNAPTTTGMTLTASKNNARLDVTARGFFRDLQAPFLHAKITNVKVESNKHLPTETMLGLLLYLTTVIAVFSSQGPHCGPMKANPYIIRCVI